MPKFFVSNNQISNDEIYILGQDVMHIEKVLRSKINDKIEISNTDNGKSYYCLIKDMNKKQIICKIEKEIQNKVESNINVTVFQGLPKSDKMEYIIQKSVEIGCFDITPVEMKRCVVKLDEKDKIKKIERWQKISEVAAKQCRRDIIPKINEIINIDKISEMIDKYDLLIVAYEEEKENKLRNELIKIKQNLENLNNRNIKIGIVIGPEGGLEKNDVDKLKENGAKIVSLGKRILRTETVALNVLSIIMYELEN